MGKQPPVSDIQNDYTCDVLLKIQQTPISRDIDLIRANVVDPSSKFLPS